ncbi:type II toxin-antitoxin system RelE/ParE family toxin [Phocaeicola sp.]
MQAIRKIKVFKTYYKEFYLAQTPEVRTKIDYVIELIKQVERVPKTYLKQIEGEAGLFEIRVAYAGNIYRIFCCNDEGQLVILFNGFQKKSQKTSPEEIKRAKSIMKEYFETKKKY